MKTLALAAVLASFTAAVADAIQDPTPPPATLQRAARLAQPDAHHATLQRLVGQWNVTLRTTLPGAEPHEDRGTVTAAPILGGRYVVANYTLTIRGVRVEAVQILGFDSLHQLWTSSWRDDASTWAIETAGPPAADAPQLLTLRGTMVDAQDPTGRPCRQVVDLRTADAVVVQAFDTIGGSETAVQEQRWTRK